VEVTGDGRGAAAGLESAGGVLTGTAKASETRLAKLLCASFSELALDEGLASEVFRGLAEDAVSRSDGRDGSAGTVTDGAASVATELGSAVAAAASPPSVCRPDSSSAVAAWRMFKETCAAVAPESDGSPVVITAALCATGSGGVVWLAI
jgi:hypothetical protein